MSLRKAVLLYYRILWNEHDFTVSVTNITGGATPNINPSTTIFVQPTEIPGSYCKSNSKFLALWLAMVRLDRPVLELIHKVKIWRTVHNLVCSINDYFSRYWDKWPYYNHFVLYFSGHTGQLWLWDVQQDLELWPQWQDLLWLYITTNQILWRRKIL